MNEIHEVDFIHSYVHLGHDQVAKLLHDKFGEEEIKSLITNLQNYV